jgi:enoyl-CoA hydratase
MAFQVKSEDGCVIVTLDRPPVNAVDPQAVADLGAWARGFSGKQPVVLTGAGASFSAGVDVRAFAAADAAGRQAFFAGITAMVRALVALPVPLVAAVNGHALGGGLVLALCADRRIAAEGSARYGLTEAKAGVPFPDGPIEVIKAEVPSALLRRMTLSSEIVSGQVLVEHGVFDLLAPPDEVLVRAIADARAMAAQPAFTEVKRQIRGGLAARLAALP